MDELSLWCDADTELLMSPQSDPLEVDSLSPTLLLGSGALSQLPADFLLDDISLDCTTAGLLGGDPLDGAGVFSLVQPSPSPLSAGAAHTHDGLRLCEFSAAACPMNPYGQDPIISEPLQPRLLATGPPPAGDVTAPMHRPQARRPPGATVAARFTPSPLSFRQPPPYPGLLKQEFTDQPPYPALLKQERTDQTHFYGELLPRRAASPLRVQPRLKVARRLDPAQSRQLSLAELTAAHQEAMGGVTYTRPAAVSSPARVALATSECKHTKPNLSYVNLITLALLNSPAGSLRCNEIYDFLQRAFPYFREINSKTWKNDTRHALSSNQSSSNFCKAPETKNTNAGGNRGALWMAKPEKLEFLHEHLAKTYFKFADNIREAMESAELYDELMLMMQKGCISAYAVLDIASPCAQSPTVGSTTDSPDGF